MTGGDTERLERMAESIARLREDVARSSMLAPRVDAISNRLDRAEDRITELSAQVARNTHSGTTSVATIARIEETTKALRTDLALMQEWRRDLPARALFIAAGLLGVAKIEALKPLLSALGLTGL